jgi:uncharacterized protein
VTRQKPDSRIRRPLLRQAWCTVTLVHWRYGKSILQPMMPPGLTVEEHGGSAWVTMAPLQMRDVRLAGVPAVPGLSRFPESSLRTYVRGPDGRPGVWFFSPDAASSWITAGARLLPGAPYFRADAGIGTGDGIGYAGTRRGRGPAAYRLHLQPGQEIQPAGLGIRLTHRWRACTRHARFLLEIPLQHSPWPLRIAAITLLGESLTTAGRLPKPADAALVHYSAGVPDVAFGGARPVCRP